MKKNCVCKEIHVVKYLPSSHMAIIKCIFPHFLLCLAALYFCISVSSVLWLPYHQEYTHQQNDTLYLFTYHNIDVEDLASKEWTTSATKQQQQKSFYAVHVVRVTLLYDQHYACRIYFRFYISRFFFSPSDI